MSNVGIMFPDLNHENQPQGPSRQGSRAGGRPAAGPWDLGSRAAGDFGYDYLTPPGATWKRPDDDYVKPTPRSWSRKSPAISPRWLGQGEQRGRSRPANCWRGSDERRKFRTAWTRPPGRCSRLRAAVRKLDARSETAGQRSSRQQAQRCRRRGRPTLPNLPRKKNGGPYDVADEVRFRAPCKRGATDRCKRCAAQTARLQRAKRASARANPRNRGFSRHRPRQGGI